MIRTLIFYSGIVLIGVSCSGKEEHKHIEKKAENNLDNLNRSVNQVVMSTVGTFIVVDTAVSPVVEATGVISYSPNLQRNISSRYGGRIEKLYVRYKFQEIKKGQRIMDVYSPEILNEQNNLVFLAETTNENDDLLNASIQKLELLGLTGEQISQIVKSKKVINPLPVFSPYNGHVHDLAVGKTPGSNSMTTGDGMNSSMKRENDEASEASDYSGLTSGSLSLREGMYIQKGQALITVFDITKLWAVLNIYQKDASLIKVGNKVLITAESISNDTIEASINYIEPVIKSQSSINARVYLDNKEMKTGRVGSILTAQIYTNQIEGIWIPRNATVDLGKSQVVFILKNQHFEAKQIQIGNRTDKYLQVLSGLKSGDVIAGNAQYLVDSESFISPAQ